MLNTVRDATHVRTKFKILHLRIYNASTSRELKFFIYGLFYQITEEDWKKLDIICPNNKFSGICD